MLTRFAIFGMLTCYFPTYLATTCELKPKGATGVPYSGGTKFRIVIATNPETYNPGQKYTIILQGRSSVIEEPNEFNGFALRVEPVETSEDPMVSYSPPSSLGVFQVLPGEINAKNDENCPNTVIHTSHNSISKIEVWWKAPDPGIGCVLFRAAVMEQNLWFRNDEGLTLKLCENKDLESTSTYEKCCSCNEAKYEMKFEGMWTRQSHPRFFPSNVWETSFSDVIGASHAFDYRIWRVNETASNGLIEFSEKKSTTMLESEIKSNKTRTVIKAKGISYPNITGKTFAAFRVDPEHHLLSLISLIKPSPDWFVGISGLELCDLKCNWISKKILDLYPYDLGLYEDIKYESKTTPLNPRELIRKIELSNNSESPFYIDHNEKLKPMARVYLTKAREYERNENNCQSSDTFDDKDKNGINYPSNSNYNPNSQDDNQNEISEQKCKNTTFGEFSDCSFPQCDTERVKVQFRQFDDSVRDFCLKHNYSEEKTIKCLPTQCKEGEPKNYAHCRKNSWSSFSKCDPVECIRTRKRTALDDSTKTDPSCFNVVWKQIINCLDCTPSKSNKKSSRRKQLSRKYNVSISASYFYVAEHDTNLCANSTSKTSG